MSIVLLMPRCFRIHLPAQSGNTDMLMRMRRNYTREAYIALADRIREVTLGTLVAAMVLSLLVFLGHTPPDDP